MIKSPPSPTVFLVSAIPTVALPAARLAATRQSSSSLSAYVPDGLTPQQWDDMKKKKADASSAKKKQVASKKYEVSCMRWG